MRFRMVFNLDDTSVDLTGTYHPPDTRGEGEYGRFSVDHGHVAARDPFQVATADGIEGHSIDAIVGRAMARVGRATW